MPYALGYSSDKSELIRIKKAARELFSRHEEESVWQGDFLSEAEAFVSCLANTGELDICCVDVSPSEGISAAEGARSAFSNADIMLIAERDMSPARYIKPSIMASSLLLRPFTEQEFTSLLSQLIELRSQRGNEDSCFIAETKQGAQRIPYRDICLFEARDRKIFICHNSRETSFYSTLERLSAELPKGFIRCHKGFIVNTAKIERIDMSENLIYLTGGYMAPFSRSYRAAVKELFK